MAYQITRSNGEGTDVIRFDHTKLLGYWLLPVDHLDHLDDDRFSTHLKMGNKGGNKFFGGNAGIRRRVD